MGRRQGITEQQLRELTRFQGSDAFDEREKRVLRYATAMTATPVEVPDELFDELARDFDAKQLVELTSCIAWENYRARYDHAFGIEAEGFSDGAFCPLPARTSAAASGED